MLSDTSNLRDLLNDILQGVKNPDYKPLSKKLLIKRLDKLDKQEIIRFQKIIADSVMPMQMQLPIGVVDDSDQWSRRPGTTSIPLPELPSIPPVGRGTTGWSASGETTGGISSEVGVAQENSSS